MIEIEKLSVGDEYKIGRRNYVVHAVMIDSDGGTAVFHSLMRLHHRVLRVVGGKWEMLTGSGVVLSRGGNV